MNIFYLDECPIESARAQCDKHVVKMILETAQLLSTAHRLLDGDEYADDAGLYKAPLAVTPSAISSNETLTDVPQCMPDDYKCSDSVAAYRSYYQQDKLSQPWAKYAYTEAPTWAM